VAAPRAGGWVSCPAGAAADQHRHHGGQHGYQQRGQPGGERQGSQAGGGRPGQQVTAGHGRRVLGRPGRRGQRADQPAHRPGLPIHGESPVQQAGRVGQLGQRGAVQDGHHQRGVAPPGPPDERGPCPGGPADLPAEVARIGVQHRVLGVQGDRLVMRPDHEPDGAQHLVVHELGEGQRLAGEQRLVVDRGVLAGGIQPVRCDRHRVVRLQMAGFGVHHGDAPAVGAGRLGQGHRGVVGRDHQQRLEQVGDRVAVTLDEPHLAGHGGRCPVRGNHRRARVEHRHQGDGGQHLQRAGRPEPAMWVLCRQHLAGSRVGDQIGRGRHAGQADAAVGGVADDHAVAGQQRAPNRSRPSGGRRASGRRRPGGGQGRRCGQQDSGDERRGHGRGGSRGQLLPHRLPVHVTSHLA